MSDHALELQLDQALDELCAGQRLSHVTGDIAPASSGSQELAQLVSFARGHLVSPATQAAGDQALSVPALSRVLARIDEEDSPRRRPVRARWPRMYVRTVAFALLLASFSTMALAQTNTPVGRALRRIGRSIAMVPQASHAHKSHGNSARTSVSVKPSANEADQGSATAGTHQKLPAGSGNRAQPERSSTGGSGNHQSSHSSSGGTDQRPGGGSGDAGGHASPGGSGDSSGPAGGGSGSDTGGSSAGDSGTSGSGSGGSGDTSNSTDTKTSTDTSNGSGLDSGSSSSTGSSDAAASNDTVQSG